jgi:excisionase family DNA binding protein
MSDELLTVEQAAAKLQMHVATVRRMLRDGELGGVKLGKKEWRVPDRAIQDLIDANIRKPATARED